MNSDLYRARSPGGVDRVLHGRAAGQPMHSVNSVHFPMLSVGAPPLHCSHPCQYSGKLNFSPMADITGAALRGG